MRVAVVIAGFRMVTAVTVAMARQRIFTGIAPCDDEGYMLTPRYGASSTSDLCELIFTQYRPFDYEASGASSLASDSYGPRIGA